MTRIRFDFGTLTLDAELLDTPTAHAIAAALPIAASALTWGEEVYFEVPVKAAREKDARLASPCNIFGKAIGDVKTLAKVRAGAKVSVTRVD
jgi:hypothetical protein